MSPGSKSRSTGYFYSPSLHTDPKPSLITLASLIHVECRILKHVASSAAEAETAAIFHNFKTALPIKRTLQSFGHLQ